MCVCLCVPVCKILKQMSQSTKLISRRSEGCVKENQGCWVSHHRLSKISPYSEPISSVTMFFPRRLVFSTWIIDLKYHLKLIYCLPVICHYNLVLSRANHQFVMVFCISATGFKSAFTIGCKKVQSSSLTHPHVAPTITRLVTIDNCDW